VKNENYTNCCVFSTIVFFLNATFYRYSYLLIKTTNKQLRSFFFLIVIFLLFGSCNSDDDSINCLLLDPLPEFFFIELVDSNGNNLIENGTFNAEDISVTVDGEVVGGRDFQFVPETNTIAISEREGDLRNNSNYIITLAQGVQDVLNLTLSASEEDQCGFIVYTATFASYNGVEQQVLDNFSFGQSIRVVRE